MAENRVMHDQNVFETCSMHLNSLPLAFSRPIKQSFCNSTEDHFKSNLNEVLQKNGLAPRLQNNSQRLINETKFMTDNEKNTSCIDLRNVHSVSKSNQYSIVPPTNKNSQEKSNVKPRITELLHLNSFNSPGCSINKQTRLLPPSHLSYSKTPDEKSVDTSLNTFRQILNSNSVIEHRNALPLCQANTKLPNKRDRRKGKIRKPFSRTKKRKLKRRFAVRKTQHRKEITQVIHSQARKNSALLAKV